MTFVLDASVALTWYFEDERTAATDELLTRSAETGAIVPMQWRLEVANGLLMAQRRKRISEAYRTVALSDLVKLPIETDPETNDHAWSATVELAAMHMLTLYDAAYLELARRRQLPLATLDEELRAAAASNNIALLAK